MDNMTIGFGAFDKHAIGIYVHILIDLGLENLINKASICCSCIFQTKRHYFLIVQAFINNEYHLFFILKCHLNLVIP